MTLWLHMFSWVVVHVLIKSYDLVLPKASPLNIQAFVMKNHFIQSQVEQLAYSTQKHLLNRVDPRIVDKKSR
jgi:excinuclease UvrABC helicase subunit UvrB